MTSGAATGRTGGGRCFWPLSLSAKFERLITCLREFKKHWIDGPA